MTTLDIGITTRTVEFNIGDPAYTDSAGFVVCALTDGEFTGISRHSSNTTSVTYPVIAGQTYPHIFKTIESSTANLALWS